MQKFYLSWKSIFAFGAIFIIAATFLYVNNLVQKIELEEKQKMMTWVEAYKELQQAPADANLNLNTQIITGNTSIPMIEVDENGKIRGFSNLDSLRVSKDTQYLQQLLVNFKKEHLPLEYDYIGLDKKKRANIYYYGDSAVLKEIRYYPFIQLCIISLFIIVILIALSTTNKSIQNQLWVGLAKETAHQLGTPLFSMEGWLEILKENKENNQVVSEMHKDLDRLKLITDRFSKIGSIPSLEEKDLVIQITTMVQYIKKRAAQKTCFTINTNGEEEIPAMISGSLFDWVIENLLKNALDSMDGKGMITIDMKNLPASIIIEITDTGKGISKSNARKIFKPGFSTKKRGWGLGLSLSKRIIESYHKGKLTLKSTELGKGSTFRIFLRK